LRINPQPVLLDHLPIGAIDLDGMPDQTTRRLFEALRLEIRYDPASRIARCSITQTWGHHRRCLPHQPGRDDGRPVGTCNSSRTRTSNFGPLIVMFV
jgi:hypothetical protein